MVIETENRAKKLMKELGAIPDLTLFETLYAPPVATEIIGKDEDEFRVYRIRVDDVIVRYVDDSYTIKVTVEGELPESLVEQLKKDITDKLAALEQTNIVCRTIPSE